MGLEKRKETLRLIKFGFFSASAGLIEMGSFSLLTALTSWPYWPCYLIALVLSVLWNFTFNRRFTFQSAANVPAAMLKVAAYYAVFTPLSTWLGHFLSENLGWNEFRPEHAPELRHRIPLPAAGGFPRQHRHGGEVKKTGKPVLRQKRLSRALSVNRLGYGAACF